MGKFSEEPGHREGTGTFDYLTFTSFISRPGWLIYPLDGDPHGEYHKIQKEDNLDKYLESLGFTVLRY